jgi:ubiquinone/menaquinone biosynthesis C-methylase UbiE
VEFQESSNVKIFVMAHIEMPLKKSEYHSFVDRLHLNGTEKVLEFGSGPGIMAKMIAEKLNRDGGSITCVDISQKWIREAQKKLKDIKNVDFQQGDLSDLLIDENSYDLVTIHFVLHDLPKSIRFEKIKILVQKLKEGGKIAIEEPLRASHGMPVEEIQEIMSNVGLKIIESNKMGKKFFGIYEK